MDAFNIDAVGPDTESVLFFQSAVKWRDKTIGIDIYLIPDRASIETLLETEAEDTDDSGSITEDAGSFGFNQASSGAESGPFASDDGGGGPFAGDDETGAAQPDGAAGDDTAADATAAGDDETDDTDDSDPFGGDDDGGAFGFGQDDDDDDPIEFEELDDTEGSQSISLDKLSVFSDLTKEGTEAAADRVTTMTGIETEADIAGVSFTPVEDIPEHLEDGQYVGTTGGFEGQPSGHLIILFDKASAENVAEAMMPMEPEGDDGLTDMHESAIEELGNIMTSGFIDGWANVLRTSVEHTPPEFADDIEMAFMNIITEQLDTFQRHAFSVESSMQTDEMDFDCKIHAIPDESELGDALESLLVDRRDETEADPDELF
jgi:chemotaxis protein CheY-P-specific phosphatase CheC